MRGHVVFVQPDAAIPSGLAVRCFTGCIQEMRR